MNFKVIDVKVKPSHDGQQNGSRRKQAIKAEKEEELRRDADALGISVAQLRRDRQLAFTKLNTEPVRAYVSSDAHLHRHILS